jgi:hypothetical protein
MGMRVMFFPCTQASSLTLIPPIRYSLAAGWKFGKLFRGSLKPVNV